MNTQQHVKLTTDDTPFDHTIFADWYHFGSLDTAAPLVVYVGGGIPRSEYLKRLHSEPVPIVNEFAAAFSVSDISNANLLVLPFPPDPAGSVNSQLFSALILDLLRQTPNPRPGLIGCVGNSIGASFASYLTFSLGQVKALATLGGYGMVEGANESSMVGEAADRSYRCWWNADSSGYMENLFFLQLLTRYDVDMDIITGSGGHEFIDYVANGSVRDAFKFVLDGLSV